MIRNGLLPGYKDGWPSPGQKDCVRDSISGFRLIGTADFRVSTAVRSEFLRLAGETE
jgi:hypothetical protein